MRTRIGYLFVLAVFCAGLFASTTTRSAPNIIFFRGDTYAAVAYSPKTGNYGYWSEAPSRFIAETMAKRKCNAKDAVVVAWVHNGFCALALGDNGAYGGGYSFGDGATNTAAKKDALAECRKHGKNARLVVCLCSVRTRPELFK